MKTVTLPMEEYKQLLADQELKDRLLKDLEKDAKDRGFFVQEITYVKGIVCDYEYIPDKNKLKIISKDEVLVKAQEEIDRLSNLCEELKKKNHTLNEYTIRMENRGFFARLFNKLP